MNPEITRRKFLKLLALEALALSYPQLTLKQPSSILGNAEKAPTLVLSRHPFLAIQTIDDIPIIGQAQEKVDSENPEAASTLLFPLTHGELRLRFPKGENNLEVGSYELKLKEGALSRPEPVALTITNRSSFLLLLSFQSAVDNLIVKNYFEIRLKKHTYKDGWVGVYTGIVNPQDPNTFVSNWENGVFQKFRINNEKERIVPERPRFTPPDHMV